MGESVYEGLTVGYCLALRSSSWSSCWASGTCARPTRVFDPLAEKAANRALATADEDSQPASGSPPTWAASTEEERKA